MMLFIWPKRWLPTFRLFWHILPKYWMQPIFQELLHSSSCYNVLVVKGIDPAVAWPVSLHTFGHPRNWNHLVVAPDLLTGLVVFAMRTPCRSGFLPIGPQWYFASCKTRRMPTVLPTLLDGPDVAPDDIKTQWQEANANGRMQFKVGVHKDSNIRMLTGTIKADWIQLPVERYLTALPTLKQGVIAGVFKNKGAAPWAISRAEKLQLSVFLPNNLSLDDWYEESMPCPLCGLMSPC